MFTVRVWDLPTRAFHWLLAALVIALVTSAKLGGAWMEWHVRLGPLVLALLLFRLVWGFVGGRWSRFGSFVHGPVAVLAYLRGHSPLAHRVSHSPLGALSVLAMLAVLLAQVGTGLMSDDEIAFVGPLVKWVPSGWVPAATAYHKHWGQWLLLSLIALHLLALLYYRWVRRERLVRAMLTGDKSLPQQMPPSRDGLGSRLGALALATASVAGVLITLEWLGR